jgi:hypothetical protein
MAPYFEIARWVALMGAGAGIWRFLSLPVYRLIAVYSRDPDRRRYALEVLRLASPYAASIKSYVDDPAHQNPEMTTAAAKTRTLTSYRLPAAQPARGPRRRQRGDIHRIAFRSHQHWLRASVLPHP